MQPHRSHLPSTFEERGTAVSFTTPLLTGCRVRKDYKGRLEVLVPSLADSKGTYVIPWNNLSEVVSLTLHDRMLYSELSDRKSITPRDLRVAVLKVAATGLAGPQAADGAKRALVEEERSKTLTNYVLVSRVVALSGKRPEEIVGIINTLEGRQIIRASLNEVARKVGSTPTELDQHIEQMSLISAPLGLPNAGPPTGLRLQLEQLAAFRDSVHAWSVDAAPEHSGLARVCADVADHTYKIGSRTIAEFDTKIAAIELLLRRYATESVAFEQMVSKLAWLLDGWQFLIDWWETTKGQPRFEQIVALTGIFRILPLIPAQELKDRNAIEAETALSGAVRGKWVRMFENWKTGDVDNELISRIEAIKAKTA